MQRSHQKNQSARLHVNHHVYIFKEVAFEAVFEAVCRSYLDEKTQVDIVGFGLSPVDLSVLLVADIDTLKGKLMREYNSLDQYMKSMTVLYL
jgi:hypothetical protein